METVMFEMALAIATEAHTGQLDKAGKPYIEHPVRVAAKCEGELAKIVAILHDVLEDCPEWTPAKLAACGVPIEAIEAIEVLTRIPGEPYEEHLAKVAKHPIAIAVKKADVADNAAPERLALLPAALKAKLEKKYAIATEILAAAGA